MSKVLLISGRKRSGKDWTASTIKSELNDLGYSVDIIAFAQPMKDIIATTLGLTLDELEQFKNDTKQFSCIVGNNDDGTMESATDFRQILQHFGNEAMKKYFGQHVWRDLAIGHIAKSTADYVIVSDFRMPEEVIPGATTVRIHSTSVDTTDKHRSETALNKWEFDYVLDNSNHKLTESAIWEFVNNQLLKETHANN